MTVLPACFHALSRQGSGFWNNLHVIESEITTICLIVAFTTQRHITPYPGRIEINFLLMYYSVDWMDKHGMRINGM
jgi:hypothetical protein